MKKTQFISVPIQVVIHYSEDIIYIHYLPKVCLSVCLYIYLSKGLAHTIYS